MMLSGPSRPLLLLLAMWAAAAAVLPHVLYPVQAQQAGNTAAKVRFCVVHRCLCMALVDWAANVVGQLASCHRLFNNSVVATSASCNAC
jgi:hypothetical protein